MLIHDTISKIERNGETVNVSERNEKRLYIFQQSSLGKINGLRHLPISLLRRHMGPFLGLWRREGDLKISASLETLIFQGRSDVPLPVYPEAYPDQLYSQ